MGRISIFIDAGYLFKHGSCAVLGATLGRHEVGLDAERLMKGFGSWVCGLYPNDELLRTYWYDGASRGVPTTEQLVVAALPFVKLRLGRINSAGQQKGVDTLIVRDLMVLSQERSIHRAVVLSGDEDLREGIEYAQDRGVRVAVVGIDANGERRQSLELLREADESLVLPAEILTGTLGRRTSVRQVIGSEPVDVNAIPPPDPHHQSLSPTATSSSGECVTSAERFAREWLVRATEVEVGALCAGWPRIPSELDALMLQAAVRAGAPRMIDDDTRRAMRTAFWSVVQPPATD